MNKSSLIHIFSFYAFILLLVGCSSQQGLFSRRTPHEQYWANITAAHLTQTALGRAWTTAAESALIKPVKITLPYKESGYFAAAEPEAQGYRFNARRGDQVEIEYSHSPSRKTRSFIDLWRLEANGNRQWVASSDTSSGSLQFEVKSDAAFVVRLQAELLASDEFTFVIKTSPSLGFPVSGIYRPRIGSFWGDQRDGGARSHEGLDIFGPFQTPVIAAADGVVTAVTLNRLGGKVVFMRPSGKDYVFYYAHLDAQLVKQGQRVQAGDTLGLMGNTGNAKNTPTHLHFGIYASGGAIDPLPFINRNRPAPIGVTANSSNLSAFMRVNKQTGLLNSPETKSPSTGNLEKNTLLRVKAATGGWYRVQLLDSSQGFIPAASLTKLSTLRTAVAPVRLSIRDFPDSSAATKMFVDKGSKLDVQGMSGGFIRIVHQEVAGWVRSNEL